MGGKCYIVCDNYLGQISLRCWGSCLSHVLFHLDVSPYLAGLLGRGLKKAKAKDIVAQVLDESLRRLMPTVLIYFIEF